MPDLKYYRRNTDSYATMPRTRQSESVVPLMNGNSRKNELIKRHLSEGTAFSQETKRRVASDSLDGRRPPNGPLGKREYQIHTI